MSITSLTFLFFCAASLLLFLVFPPRYRWIALLLSSLAFYVYSAKTVAGFILLTSLSTWYAALLIDREKKRADEELAGIADKSEKKRLKEASQKKRRTILIIALILNIGILVSFKILNLFADAFRYLAGLFPAEGDALKLILPLGISYYTFSTVGYLLDVYWKRYESEKNFFRFLLFAAYYPHILQGPISRYNKLGEELKKPELRFTWDNFIEGSESILLGCFKKLVIADRAAVFVNAVFPESGLSGGAYLLAMILDALQIYTDFSGYMDIVSGISKMFDVKLEQNFNHPFLSKTIPEFWRRWHMSLGSWFKDYVYYPVSVSKLVKRLNKSIQGWKSVSLRKLVSVIIPVMVTWILTGLWHGTGSGYVAWGLYYGCLIAISVTLSESFHNYLLSRKIPVDSIGFRPLQSLKIFCVFMGGRFLASTVSWSHKGEIIRSIFTAFRGGSVFDFGLGKTGFLILFASVALLILISVIEERRGSIFEWFNGKSIVLRFAVVYAMFFLVFILGVYGSAYSAAGFMYQQF